MSSRQQRPTLLRLMGMDERDLGKIASSMNFFGTDTEENERGGMETRLLEVTAKVEALEEHLSRRIRALEELLGKLGKVKRISRHDTAEEEIEEKAAVVRKKSAAEIEDAVAIKVNSGMGAKEATQQVLEELEDEDQVMVMKDGKVRGVDAFFACLSGRLIRCERKVDEGNVNLQATKRLLEMRLQTGLSGMLEITRTCQQEQSVSRVRLESAEKHLRDVDGNVKAALLQLGYKPKTVPRAGEIPELPACVDKLSSTVTELGGQVELVGHDVEALQAPVTRLDNHVREMDVRLERLESANHEMSLHKSSGEPVIEQGRRCSWWPMPDRRTSIRVQDGAAGPLQSKVERLDGSLKQLSGRFDSFLAELNGLRF